MLGRSYLDPTNVDVSGETLRIKLPARTLEGGEVLTNELHGYGSYGARIKLPNAPGSITGFFLYKAPDYESEIDIEIYNDSSRRIMFTTYAGGTQTHTKTVSLPFDPTSGFREYRFDYLHGTVQNSVTFYVDGVQMSSWDTGIPQTSRHLMLDSWFPSWLDGRRRPHTPTWTGSTTPSSLETLAERDILDTGVERHAEAGRKHRETPLAADSFASQRLAQSAEHPCEFVPILLAQLREQISHRGAVLVVDTVHRPGAPSGHLDDGGPPVRGVGLPPDQSFFLQRVHQRRDVAPRNTELVADAGHDLGPTAVQSPEQPHPGIRHPPVLQTRPDPLQVQRSERGELVDEPQRRSFSHRFSIHRTHDPPRTRDILATPLVHLTV